MGKKIVLVGASSAIAEHCARIWALESPSEMVLVGRTQERLDAVANDLKIRSSATRINTHTLDFNSAESIDHIVEKVSKQEPVDIVLIAHGSLLDQEVCQADLTACESALKINGVSPVLFAEAFAKHMHTVNHGTLAIIGSVAGDRGRKSNYIYGAAKGLVTRYAQGLQHRLASTNVSVVLIKPGPTDTPMTAVLKEEGAKLASVESVAASIVRGIAKKRSVVYAPTKWALIMLVIRHLPAFIFNKLDI